MERVIKRNGSETAYEPQKIKAAVQKAFSEVQQPWDEQIGERIVASVEAEFKDQPSAAVEDIQNVVEKSLMKEGCYDVAKAYILYRQQRTRARNARRTLCNLLQDPALEPLLEEMQKELGSCDLERLILKFQSMDKEALSTSARMDVLIRSAEELTTKEEPAWEKAAGRLLSYQFHKQLKQEEENRGIHSFYDKLVWLTQEGYYGSYILENYSSADIEALAENIDDSRDKLFTWAGLDLLLSRYVIHTRSHVAMESPQELFMGVAMHLGMKEKENRLAIVRRFYDMLSLHKVTMATPTLANARKPYHQLSSCFIDTVPDSLDGIYTSISNFAEVSKFGGGMGMYLGKVRARGSSIRGFEGAAGGVIRWIRVINDTAVAVDQLGVRQGAAAVYLDAWHMDLPEFLQLRTNNGDDRMKAHDLFPAVCYPDLFWRMAKENLNQNWYLLDPHEVLIKKGYALEDSWGKEWEEKYFDCVRDSRIRKRTVPLKEIVRLILRSAVETGTPFAFFRDAVNAANPNKHAGMIYCSNLCTEIAQNMSETDFVSQTIQNRDGDDVIVTVRKPGNYVVCNLASLCLGNINVDDQNELESVTRDAVRALDNVIDLNFYPVPAAEKTNHTYRSIGLGVSGYHHMLAKHHVKWESEEHLQLADRVFEDISYAAVKASSELARERGSYSLFHGSEWESGMFFERRNYTDVRWQKLRDDVRTYGMRNAYVIADAPTSSTSILVGTTAGLDPVMNRYYLEEKKGAILPRVAPDLSPATWWYYKNAHSIDQTWSVKAAAVRQRHIDQAQSFNLWITNEYKMSQLLNLYILADELGVKTIYYVRSRSLDPDECESCSA
ncbi:ribonucleoside-diphosphate reductase subunit alpha [Galactobacillus timonensis]|uniref:ribonucleoside-diphosphate reductase subunit alpha n=1 Tax=Galactobacillus timonensis TaxID=2041840 RepID=UPI000C84AB18|nr:ribonucleoside-diphosphate reductase subunit alpha [Galactobacillus timonensis]